MKKSVLIIAIIILIVIPLVGEKYNSKFSVFLRGGIQFIQEEGNISDYSPGLNHFPITPSHNNISIGMSFNIKLIKKLGLELGANINKGSEITLVDPGDNDELRYKSLDQYNYFASLIYRFTQSRVVPYIALGGGLCYSKGDVERSVKTNYGYDVTLLEVEPTYSGSIRGSFGTLLYLFRGFAFRVEASYIYKFSQNNPVFQIVAGFQIF